MKINLFENDKTESSIGGGWTFLRNLKKGLQELNHQITSSDFDISMACGATMVTRDEWTKASVKPVVLRADGIPEDFRNRGTGWSRFRDYARSANLVIHQSEFSRQTTGRLVGGPTSEVIYNGVDTSIFTPVGSRNQKFGSPSILFIYYRNDPNKRVQEAIERFRQFKIDNPNSTISFLGNYPHEQFFWNNKSWDFGMLDLKENVDWRYLGIVRDRAELATHMRSHDFLAFPSFADPCPNTLIEGMACGLKPLWINEYGSSVEIVKLYQDRFDFSLRRMTDHYVRCFNELIR